jgi:eukaryotic-like serine/threonine-protein kinase
VEGPDPIRTLLERDPPPLDERAPYVPAPIVEVVQRAIRREPDERWPTAAVFKDALMQSLRLS